MARTKNIYIKSDYTGQVHCTDFIPQFGGWTVVTEAEFIEWCESHGFDPNSMRK